MSSTFKVPLTKILEVNPHPNADRLELVKVYGFDIVTGKGKYKVDDQIILIPIDSVIPPELDAYLFPPDAKIKLNKHRVRQIRIRKCASQGMVMDANDVKAVYGFAPNKLEEDYSEKLRIVKYEPPSNNKLMHAGQARKKKRNCNSHFRPYGGLDNIKWYPFAFKPTDTVSVTEKIHGTNARAGILPYEANTFLKKIASFLGLTPEHEFCYGSNNVQLGGGLLGKKHTYYDTDVYTKVLIGQLNVESKLQPGETIYGEIYGDGIQKNYTYGCASGEHKFILFDVKKNFDGIDVWLTPQEVVWYAKDRGFDTAPELYNGLFDMELVKSLTKGDSVLAPTQKIREGVVVKNVNDSKIKLKVISEDYLDKDNSDFH